MNDLLLAATDPKVAFEVFGRGIRWYALIIILGMLVALVVLSFALKRDGHAPDFSFVMFLWLVPLAVVFCRLFYVIPRGDEYKVTDWESFIHFIDPSTGGLTIIGGIFGGAIGIILCSLVHKKSLSRLLDVMPFPLLIAQAIGRWGNYVNQELFGQVVTNESQWWFPFAVFIEDTGKWHYASFFYESFLNLIGFFVLGFLFLKFRNKFKPGSMGLLYLFYYPLVRALLEFIKYDKLSTASGVGIIQITCFVISAVALVLFVLNQVGIIKLETKKEYARHLEQVTKQHEKNIQRRENGTWLTKLKKRKNKTGE